jgi:hypothetical protein
MQHKDHETFRLFFDNQNGFNLTSKGAAFKELCEDQLLLQADYRGIAEPCLDTDKYQVRQTLHDIAKQTFESYALDMASSPVTAAHNYQPGGVMSIMQGHTIGRIKSRGNDELGRWTYVKLFGRSDKVITLISAYQVCNNARTGTTAYHQQQSALIQCGDKLPNPRRQFQHDLRKFLRQCQANSESIILVGDFNENLDINTSGTAKLCEEHELVDIFAARHPDIEEFSTYIRGTKRIDYYLVSSDIIPAVTAVGYEPYHYRTTSDHRGLFLDLDVGTLFGNATTALAAQPFRDLRSKDLQSNTTYIDATSAHLHSNHFFQNLTTLLTKRDDDLAVRLDNLLVQACQHGEKQCRKRVSLWWSQKLTQARLHRNFLYRALCGYRNNIDVRPAIKARMTELNVHFDIPSTKEECNTAFKEAKAEYKKIARDHLNIRLAELDEAAEAHALAKDKDKAQIVKEIKHQESIAATFRKIRNVTKPAHARGSTSIEVPTTWPPPSEDITARTSLPDPKKASTWRTVDLPKDVLHYLLLRNRLHFGQAEGTH